MTARGRSTGGGAQLVLGMCAFFYGQNYTSWQSRPEEEEEEANKHF